MNNAMTPEIDPKEGLLTMGLVALLGGVARNAHQWLSGKKVTWQHFVFRAAISVFIGVICYYALPKDAPWAFATCGLCSWLGADGVSLMIQLFIKKGED